MPPYCAPTQDSFCVCSFSQTLQCETKFEFPLTTVEQSHFSATPVLTSPLYWLQPNCSKIGISLEYFFSLALQPPWALASNFQFHDRFIDDGTPWTSDQLAARPLPKQRTTQTQNKHIHIPNIHALCGIRTHDPGFRASEDSICLRALCYRDRHLQNMTQKFTHDILALYHIDN
jgi:hypothetical protein